MNENKAGWLSKVFSEGGTDIMFASLIFFSLRAVSHILCCLVPRWHLNISSALSERMFTGLSVKFSLATFVKLGVAEQHYAKCF